MEKLITILLRQEIREMIAGKIRELILSLPVCFLFFYSRVGIHSQSIDFEDYIFLMDFLLYLTLVAARGGNEYAVRCEDRLSC
jgi:hypothetical protein